MHAISSYLGNIPTHKQFNKQTGPITINCTAVPAAENNTRVGLARSMARPGARAYNGGLGRSPQRGPGAEPPVWGQGGEAP